MKKQGVEKMTTSVQDMTKYTTIAGDRWDIIAYKTTGSEFNLDKLMKANVEYIETVIFPAGVELNIPKINIEPDEGLPVWKRGN